MKTEVAKLNVRLPIVLREDAAQVAADMSQSLNGFIVEAVKSAVDYHAKRLLARQRQAQQAYGEAPASTSTTAVMSVTRHASADLPKVGANQPCPCGSGEKYKRCHGKP